VSALAFRAEDRLVAGVEDSGETGVDTGALCLWTLAEPLVFRSREHDGHVLVIVSYDEGLLLSAIQQRCELNPVVGGRDGLHMTPEAGRTKRNEYLMALIVAGVTSFAK
jgi:hypothetical protein